MTSDIESAIRDLLRSALLDVAREVLPPRLSHRAEWSEVDTPEERMLLRSSEAAESLAISESQLHKMTRSGILPCVRVGRLVRYNPDTIREWIKQSESTEELQRSPTPVRRRTSPIKEKMQQVAPKQSKDRTTRKKQKPAAKTPERQTSSKASVAAPPRQRRSNVVAESPPRSARSFFAERLGVSVDAFPQMTNGELMRIAEVDTPALHGWTYHNRDLPEAAIAKLHAYFAGLLDRQQ